VKQPPPQNPPQPPQKQPTVVQNPNPITPVNNPPKKDNPNINQVNGAQNTPKQNVPQTQPNPEPGKLLDFGNFFGTGNAPQPQPPVNT
jgi:hypothetical protein